MTQSDVDDLIDQLRLRQLLAEYGEADAHIRDSKKSYVSASTTLLTSSEIMSSA
jgi:hypothetical protein